MAIARGVVFVTWRNVGLILLRLSNVTISFVWSHRALDIQQQASNYTTKIPPLVHPGNADDYRADFPPFDFRGRLEIMIGLRNYIINLEILVIRFK